MIPCDVDVTGMKFINHAELTDSNGNTISVDESHFLNGVTFYDESAKSEFTLGNVMGKRLRARLNNFDGTFNNFNFLNAHITIECITQYVTPPITINKGTYYILNSVTPNDVIEFDAVDSVCKLDKQYATDLEYPASLLVIFRDAITKSGISTEITNFDNSNYVINDKPQNCSFRNIFGWIAMMAGCNARFDVDSKLVFIRYDKNTVIPDSKALSPYTLSMTTNTITVNGVKVINSDNVLLTKGQESGDAYYVVAKDNPFIDNHEENFANYLLAKFENFVFRNFDGEFPGNPLFETHDAIKVKDRKGQIFQTVITSIEYNAQGATKLQCQIDNPTINNADYKTEFDRNVQAARDKMREYVNNYILFSNKAKVTTVDGGPIVQIAEQEFAVVKPVPILIMMEFLLTMATTSSSTEDYDIYNEASVIVNYYYDDMNHPLATWKPKESFDDGDHVLELSYLLTVNDLNSHNWAVGIQSTGGSITIKPLKARSVMSGQGLIGNLWDGTIKASDSITPFNFQDILREFEDDGTVTTNIPIPVENTEQFQVFNFYSMLHPFEDSVTADNDMVEMFYGDGLSDDTYCPNHQNDTWTGSGYIISMSVTGVKSVTTNGSVGIEYLVSFDGGQWVGLQNGSWVADASMSKSQLEAITQSQWEDGGSALRIKATLGTGATLSSLIFHGAEIQNS